MIAETTLFELSVFKRVEVRPARFRTPAELKVDVAVEPKRALRSAVIFVVEAFGTDNLSRIESYAKTFSPPESVAGVPAVDVQYGI